ncbi:hypothetical protein ACWD5V_08615 [Streptomyces sp. NPDC002523]
MGVYVTIRGWLECDDPQLERIRAITSAVDADPVYRGGWTFPERQCAWRSVVFFGADMRAQDVGAVLDQLRVLARVPAFDEDGDRVVGLFVVSHEVDGRQEWQVREGRVVTADLGSRYAYLDE